MFTRKFSVYLSLLLLTFPSELASGFQAFTKADEVTQASPTERTPPNRTVIHFQPPPDDGKPKDPTASGGTRGKCPQDANQSLPLTLLLPRSQGGLTVAEHPVFFAYVPQTQTNTGEFVLFDPIAKKIIYRTLFRLNNTSVIVKIEYPSNQPPLEIGKTYQWRLLLRCKSDDRAKDADKVGWIERIAPPAAVASLQNSTTATERAQVYAENGIWYDALKTLAELKRTNASSSNVTATWREFLSSESVKLDPVVAYPLVECCKPEN